MTREEAIKGLKRLSYEFSGYKPNEEMFDMAIKALEQEPYDDAKYHEEHGEVVVDKAVWEDAKRALEQEPRQDLQQAAEKIIEEQNKWFEEQERKEQEPAYCDRNICIKNEYNNIGCEECEVTKSQEPSGDTVSRQAVLDLAKFDERKGLGTIIHALDVEQLPSVKPQPKTGHWIEHPEIKTITPEIMFYECSECGDKQCFCKSDIHKKHFCNYCGARMVEPTCDTCEYNTAAFNPCNACKDKSEYKPQESEKV